MGQSTKSAASIHFVFSLGALMNNFTINILIMWPHVFLLLFLKNSVPGIEFWGQRIYVFLIMDLAKLPFKKVVTLYIPASNVWELPSYIPPVINNRNYSLVCVCAQMRTCVFAFYYGEFQTHLKVGKQYNEYSCSHQLASTTVNPCPFLPHPLSPVSYHFKANSRHHFIHRYKYIFKR